MEHLKYQAAAHHKALHDEVLALRHWVAYHREQCAREHHSLEAEAWWMEWHLLTSLIRWQKVRIAASCDRF